jgi:hypothetical protein
VEREAREGGKGLWAASDATTPARAPSQAEPWPCPGSRPIKGNMRRAGECIYHLPGDRYYLGTKPEKCFATEIEASEAGCRRAKS